MASSSSRCSSGSQMIAPRTTTRAIHGDVSARSRLLQVHRNGATAAATAFDTIAYAFTQITGPDVGYTEMDEDYAVLVIDQRLGDRFGWMGTKTYDSSWDDEDWWRTIGYPGDVGGGTVPTY